METETSKSKFLNTEICPNYCCFVFVFRCVQEVSRRSRWAGTWPPKQQQQQQQQTKTTTKRHPQVTHAMLDCLKRGGSPHMPSSSFITVRSKHNLTSCASVDFGRKKKKEKKVLKFQRWNLTQVEIIKDRPVLNKNCPLWHQFWFAAHFKLYKLSFV